jgi:hypothetical protein
MSRIALIPRCLSRAENSAGVDKAAYQGTRDVSASSNQLRRGWRSSAWAELSYLSGLKGWRGRLISKSGVPLAAQKITALHWCPLRDALWRALRCTNAFLKFAVIRRARVLSFSAVITFFASSATPTTAPADIGIAARYPGDKNIADDPAVIFADDFESYTSPSQLTMKWSAAYRLANLAISPLAFSGNKCIEMSLPVGTTEVANALEKNISPTEDVLYLRAYQKWDVGYDNTATGANHNGIRLSAKYPGPGAPPPADGTGFFLFLLQNIPTGRAGETTPGDSHLYVYWPQQLMNYGDLWFPDGGLVPSEHELGTTKGQWVTNPTRYPDFKPLPNFQPRRNRWYCYELMVKANTPGENDGEVAYWIDGKLAADFPDLNIRSVPTLKLDKAVLVLHAKYGERVNKKWYDNVVIAKKYIGPMVTPTPTPNPGATPTPTATSAPTPTPTATPTTTPTATPTLASSPTATPTAGLTPTPTPERGPSENHGKKWQRRYELLNAASPTPAPAQSVEAPELPPLKIELRAE